jgi:hypothetical protein
LYCIEFVVDLATTFFIYTSNIIILSFDCIIILRLLVLFNVFIVIYVVANDGFAFDLIVHVLKLDTAVAIAPKRELVFDFHPDNAWKLSRPTRQRYRKRHNPSVAPQLSDLVFYTCGNKFVDVCQYAFP